MSRRLTDRPSDYTFGKRRGRWPLTIAGVVVALACIGVGSYLAFGRSHTTPSTTAANVDERVPRLLDGVLVPPAQATLPAIAIMVENHVSVRPQSGLSKAGVVYEVLAEGGITRFLAVFSTADDVSVGPVRSARPYFVDLAREYGGLYVHAGYSPQAKTEIQETHIADYDQFFHPAAFTRMSDRPAEHALFTTLQALRPALAGAGVSANARFAPWVFQDGQPAAVPTTKPITIDFSTASYRVSYTYDATTNRYLRAQGGAAATDGESTPIAPANVVVLFTTSKLFDTLRRDISVIGDGKALIFSNGQVTTGTWRKESASDRLTFQDSTKQAIAFTRGQTWVEVVDVPEKNVAY